MNTAFVLGNGISRKDLDLNHIKTRGKLYGCNSLYTEIIPDVLVATDKPIADKIQNSEYALKNRFYTRRPIIGLGGKTVLHHTFSSGPNAVAIAIDDRCTTIYLLGFDMGPDDKNEFNNVYAGTEFYKAIGSSPTYAGNWVKQLTQIMETSYECNFIRVCGDTTAIIPELNSIKNLSHITIQEFLAKVKK